MTILNEGSTIDLPSKDKQGIATEQNGSDLWTLHMDNSINF